MKSEDYFYLFALSISFLLSVGTVGYTLYLLKWAKGKQLLFATGIVSGSWWISSIAALILAVFFLESEDFANQNPFWLLTILRMSAIVFITTGINSGVLYLLKSYRSATEDLPTAWRTSFITSLVCCLTVFGFLFLFILLFGSYFIEPQEFHCNA